MFANTGLFRDKPCPYFIHGLCSRPYCHFKHCKVEEAKAKKKTEEAQKAASQELDDEYIVPTSALQQKLESIEETIQSEKQKLLNKDKSANDVSTNPIISIAKTQPTGTPKYNPTPLRELEKQKIKGKLGLSKYELAMLDGPAAVGEYDPASNFSTFSGKSHSHATSDEHNYENDSLPDYVKSIHGEPGNANSKEENEGEIEIIPTVKIPEFVSVDYTPTTLVAEFSDEEKQDSFSENDREKADEIEKSSTLSEETKQEDNESDLPIEFTADGFVKSKETFINKISKTEKEEPNPEVTTIRKENRNDNIFSMFKEEFDQELETCATTPIESTDILTKSESKHKEKKNHADLTTKTNGKHSSHHSHKHSSVKDDKTNSKRDRHNSHSKHSNSSSKHSTTPSKHSNSSSKHSASSSKHLNSLKSNNGEYSSKIDRHKEHSKHNDSSSHHSARSSKNGEFLGKSDKSSKHTSKSSHDKDKNNHKQSEKGIKTSHSHEKTSKHSNKHSTKSDKDRTDSAKKKKKILNVDVDLFGIESDQGKSSGANNHSTLDLDLDSDLEKYFSDEDPFDECLRIFNEQPKASTSSSDKKKSKKNPEQDLQAPAVGKKRVALKESDQDSKKRKVEPERPKPKPSPAQVMMNRYKMMQERALQAEEEAIQKKKAKVRQISEKNKAKISTQTTTSSSSLGSAEAAFKSYLNDKKKTSAITVSKGQKRKAHTPTVAIAKLKRPVVEVTTSSKVGANIRQRYLNLFIDECLKLCSTEKEAFERGKEEEETIYKRCTNKKIYLNTAVITIKRLRNEIEEKKNKKKPENKSKGTALKLSHAALLDGAQAKKTNFTLHRSGGAVKLQEEDFLGVELYKRLKPYIMTEEQLKANNYPRPNPDQGGTAIFFGQVRTTQKGSTKGYEKLCVRCGRVFEVYPNGKYPVKEDCLYHWGKAWKRKIAGSLETRYTCCSGDLSSDGCQVAKAHVHETNKMENLTGFMKTIPSSPPIDGDYGVYALDCEMVYTTMGIELARVTVVGGDAEPVYESFVKPDNPIVDHNTRFSGITEDDMEDVTTTIRDVQAVLLSLFTDKTILLGHSLESDLLALKLIHSTVVDTSIVFPHRMGLPYKRALRNLMSEYLKKIIQDDVGGHDSLEDAVACIELMQYQLKEDARKEARRLST